MFGLIGKSAAKLVGGAVLLLVPVALMSSCASRDSDSAFSSAEYSPNKFLGDYTLASSAHKAEFYTKNLTDEDIVALVCCIEQERIRQRFPHVSGVSDFIRLDSGTLVDKRLFEAWPESGYEGHRFGENDLWLIFDMIIEHFNYMNNGDMHGMFRSTMMGVDIPDANVNHPLIVIFMHEQKNTALFVESIELSSIGAAIRVVVSNDKGDMFHIWPFIDMETDSWRIARYTNHLPKEWWITMTENEHLWEYIEYFNLHRKHWLDALQQFWATGNYNIWDYVSYFHLPIDRWPLGVMKE